MNLRARKNDQKIIIDEEDSSDPENDFKKFKPTTKKKKTNSNSKEQIKNDEKKLENAETESEYFPKITTIKDQTTSKPKTNKREKKVNANHQEKKTQPKNKQLKSENTNQSEPKNAPNLDHIKTKLEDCSCLETKIDLMLKFEAKSNLRSNSKFTSNEESNVISDQSDDESEDEFEEVKMELNEPILKFNSNSKNTPRESIQIVINDKKPKKEVDLKAKMERMLKAMQKKLAIATIKAHLVCWVGHGLYLNKICSNPFIRSLVLSLDQLNINNFQLANFNRTNLEDLLNKAKNFLKCNDSLEFLNNNILVDRKNLSQSISNNNCSNYLSYILIILIALRNLNIKVRLCVCFEVLSIKEEFETKSKKDEEKEKRVSKSKKRKSTNDGDDENDSDETDNSDKSKKSLIQKKNKISKKNNLILSDDENNKSNSSECSLALRNTNNRNYWLEVYLEEEKFWCPIEPYSLKIDCANYLESRFEKRVLYVCAFDNDNRIKDVTKRYSSQWETTTRLLRISHLDDKKHWWEKFLLRHQPLDPILDIEEEINLKKMLMAKPIPQSISEFKDHPLYVLPRHLLKFQSIYPNNCIPYSHFRNEPVHLRDNLVTLHSKQTWLKLARTVKQSEKPFKIVKGRLKMSEYKAGRRDNPDLDLYGYWQTKPYEPPYAYGGIVPRNEFGNVELFQPNMLPHGCVHLKNMPNLLKVCRKLKIDCAAAVVGFDAHGGFSHAVYDGWVVCEEFKDVVTDAYIEEERENNRKLSEKKQERVLNNWKRLVRGLLLTENLKLKYGTDQDKTGQNICKKINNYSNKISKSKSQLDKSLDELKTNDDCQSNSNSDFKNSAKVKNQNRKRKKQNSTSEEEEEEDDEKMDSNFNPKEESKVKPRSNRSKSKSNKNTQKSTNKKPVKNVATFQNEDSTSNTSNGTSNKQVQLRKNEKDGDLNLSELEEDEEFV